MLITFQIILLIILVISLMGSVGGKELQLRNNMAALAIASIIAFIVTSFIFCVK